jgi:carnitine O-acetyltransferase
MLYLIRNVTAGTFLRERRVKSAPTTSRALLKWCPQSTLDTSSSTSSTNDIHFVESNGDYRRDAELLEDPSRPLYAHQQELPLLPVPSLEETIDTFLPTALPFCKDDKERTSLLQAAESFPGQAATLQERLLQRRDENKDTSWLQQWWNQLGYLQARTSNAIHVSYFLPLRDDPSTSCTMTTRGAALLQTATLYYHDIQDGSLAPDSIRQRSNGDDSIPLCSAQYKYLFSSSRIPRVNQDTYRIYEQTFHPQHAVVAVRGQFYKIQVTDDQGKVLSRKVLESALQELLEERPEEGSIPEMGWLSATNRDTWSQTYEWLENIPAMKAALEELQSGLCLLCLDVDGDDNNNNNTRESPTSSHLHDRQTALQFWHGNGKHSANRWFDKSMQLLITPNAHVAYQGEHSMADGMPVMNLCEVLVEKGACDNPEPADVVVSAVHAEPIFPQALEQMSNREIEKLSTRVLGAKQEFLDNIARHDMHKLYFTDYGSQHIKSSGFSPDAFVQIAMQLAGCRVFGTTVGSYESIQTRPFLHGRTETTRSVSIASQAFCNAMVKKDPKKNTVEMNRDLLEQAVDAHVAYTKRAVQGRGVDRHFFGLGKLLEEGEELPDLMVHPVFSESKTWRLSTSTVPGLAPGFGNVEKDGCGIGYDVLKDHCVFTVAAERQTGYAREMKDEIAMALADMRVFL